MRGHNLINKDSFSPEDMEFIFNLVYSPTLKMSRRDYSRQANEDFNWIFSNDPICGPTSALRELVRLALVGYVKELTDES